MLKAIVKRYERGRLFVAVSPDADWLIAGESSAP